MKISTQKQKTGKFSFFGKIGIFSASLLTAVSAVYIYSPVIGSPADESITSKVSATISPVASVTLDTSNVSFVFTPTASGIFDSKPVIATVATNSTGGYELYFSAVDDDTDMKSLVTESVIASDFSGTVTSSSMAANKWGYSLNNTDFSKIPALNAQATLKNIDHYPTTSEKTTTVNIGMKVDTNLPSGAYSKNLVFSVLAHETPVPTPTMQSFACSELSNVGDSKILTDTRDDNTYTVKKLADGKCWMTQNLRIIDKKLDSTTSDLPDGYTWTVPASAISGWSWDTNNAYLGNKGGYYPFYTATAGWGGTSTTNGNAQMSICPKNWKLPTTSDYTAMANAYDNNPITIIRDNNAPTITLNGLVGNGNLSNATHNGYYWTATNYDNDSNDAHFFYVDDWNDVGQVIPDADNVKTWGLGIRCMARE